MRNKVFRGPDAAAQYQRAGMWLLAAVYGNEKAQNWCQKNGVPLRKAQGETVDQYGAYLVPKELSDVIMDLRDSYGAFRRRARIVPMASDSTIVARKTGNVTGYFVAENAAITASTDTVNGLELTTRKIGALVLLSSELEEDALSDVIDYLANEIAFAFAQKEDDAAFNGDGTATYAGMVGVSSIALDAGHTKCKVTAASGHNTFLTLDQTDLGNLLQAVLASAIPNAAWFVSQTGFAQTMCRLSGGSNGYMETRIVDGVPTPCFLGFPVILAQKLPLTTTSLTGKVMMAFGDMYAGGVLGQRKAISIARSADRYLDSDQIAVRGIERVHCVISNMGDTVNFGALAAIVAP